MEKKIEKENVPTINVSYENSRLQIAVENKPCMLFTFEKFHPEFKKYEGLPIFSVEDIKTFNVITQDAALVNQVFENELMRKWFTMCGLVNFINQNISYIIGEKPIYIHNIGEYKMVQFISYYEGNMEVFNAYFDRNVENDTILEDCVKYSEGDKFTRSFLQISYLLLRKKNTPFTIDFYKNDWYFSLEYLTDVCSGDPVLSKRDDIFRHIIYNNDYSISFSDTGIPLVASEKFNMFQKNDKKDLEEIHCAFINRIMMSLLLHSQYSSFYNTYSKNKTEHSENKDNESFALHNIEDEVAKRFVDVPMSTRTSQKFLKEQFDSAVVKYDIYPQNVKGNIKSIKQVYVRSENPTVNNGFIIRAEFTGKKYIFFKIDDILTQGREELVEEMVYQIIGYIEIISKILKGGTR